MKCPLRWGTDEANREVLTSLISASRTFGDAEEAVLAIVGEFRDSGSLSMLGEVGEVKEKNDKAMIRR